MATADTGRSYADTPAARARVTPRNSDKLGIVAASA